VGSPTRFDYLFSGDPAFVLGAGTHYFADASYVREAALADDGLWRTARLGLGKPAAVWGDAVPGTPGTLGSPAGPAAGSPGSIVLSVLDEQRLPAWLVVRRDPGRAAAAAGVSQPLATPGARPGGNVSSAAGPSHVDGPRLLVQVAGTSDLRNALAAYRGIVATAYPPAPLPDWLRYQWGSWWVYGSSVDEGKMRRQIDVIANELGDLGPWHILIDAGWQDVGPDGSDDLGQDQRTRFPSGLRALVDYAHARGIRVILFYSAVYAHDGSDKGEWLGLPRLTAQHRDWFLPLTPEGVTPGRFLFDYANPGAHDYLASVLRRMVTDYNADGVKIDGLGDVEGELIPFGERARVLPRRWALTPVMDVYRTVAQALWSVKPDAFIESGWVNPTTAQPYAHTFRYGDEWDTFDRRYPFPGLAEHFTYAAVQQGILGQRPNVGAVYGGLNRPLADQWLGAALATGAQVSLGSDLTFLSPEGVGLLRALLVHQRPFAGTTRTGPEGFGLEPDWSATTVGELTFVGLLNRQQAPRHLEVPLAQLGLNVSAGSTVLAYDANDSRYVRVRDVLAADVPPQTLALFVLRATPGVVWTTSSFEEQAVNGGWRVVVHGPSDVAGMLQFHLPGGAPSAVLLDGARLAPLTPTASDGAEGFTYDPVGVLTVHYAHAGLQPGASSQPARTIDVRP
jgi:hypothetical protein